MDVNLDALWDQKNTSGSSKGNGSPGAQQGHYPCMNNNRNAMLNSLQDDAVTRTDSSEMTDVESVIRSFASSARAGRRNAVPDIQSSAITGGSSDLPLKLEALSMQEDVKKKNEEKAQDQLEKPLKEEK